MYITITLTNANSDFLGALKKLLSSWQGITLNTYDEPKPAISALSLVGAWEDDFMTQRKKRSLDEIKSYMKGGKSVPQNITTVDYIRQLREE